MSKSSSHGSAAGTGRSLAIVALLADLQSAHENLAASMRGMDRLTRGPLADRDSYTGVRWRLSQASLTRRNHWAKIYQNLIAWVAAEDAAALNDLQARDMRMRQCSATHVYTWSRDAIDSDWPGYCKASRAIRSQMQSCMDAEMRVLYPMLKRLASDHAYLSAMGRKQT